VDGACLVLEVDRLEVQVPAHDHLPLRVGQLALGLAHHDRRQLAPLAFFHVAVRGKDQVVLVGRVHPLLQRVARNDLFCGVEPLLYRHAGRGAKRTVVVAHDSEHVDVNAEGAGVVDAPPQAPPPP